MMAKKIIVIIKNETDEEIVVVPEIKVDFEQKIILYDFNGIPLTRKIGYK